MELQAGASRVTRKPMRRQRAILVQAWLLFAIVTCSGAHASCDLTVYQFYVPTTSDEKRALGVAMQWLADNARTIPVNVNKDEDLIAVLHDEYGDAWAYVWPLMRKFMDKQIKEQNTPGLRKMPEKPPKTTFSLGVSMRLPLPAGPKWTDDSDVVVHEGEDLTKIAQTNLGRSTPAITKNIHDMNGLHNTILVPHTHLRVVRSDPVVILGVDESKYDTFCERSRAALLKVAVPRDPDSEHVRPVEPTAMLASAGECASDGSSRSSAEGYPVDWDSLQEQLLINDVLVKSLPGGDRLPSAVTAAVIDSGVNPDEPSWQRIQFWSDSFASTPGGALVVGYDFTRHENYQSAWPSVEILLEKYRNHGTHVAGILTGAPSSDAKLVNRIKQLVNVAVFKIMPRIGESGSPEIDGAALTEALTLISQPPAALRELRVVNLSIQSTRSLTTVVAPIKRSRDMLYVVAAGNTGVNIDGSTEVPAWYAKELTNVISVAAHDRNGDLTATSSHGEASVTLAAPGQCIHSLGAGSQTSTEDYSGTSQAAPFVTLTAALLFSYVPQLGTRDVKYRIIASSDHDSRYESIAGDSAQARAAKVSARGRLNMIKALSFFQDIVESPELSNRYRRGFVRVRTGSESGSEWIRVGQRVTRVACALAVQWLADGKQGTANTKVRLWRLVGPGAEPDKDLVPIEGKLESTFELFTDDTSNATRVEVDWTKTSALVLSTYRHRETGIACNGD